MYNILKELYMAMFLGHNISKIYKKVQPRFNFPKENRPVYTTKLKKAISRWNFDSVPSMYEWSYIVDKKDCN